MSADWRTVIGLETHCQLGTRTKLFCGCKNEFGAPPNSNTCPICTGQPGVLPVLNENALALGVRAALTLDCDVARRSSFDRKNYFYCDLPKGFQTTQYARPIATGGGITLAGGRFVRLTRMHLEEDAGKAIHERGDSTLIDLNRAGVPLIEIVTEPDLTTADEAVEYLTRLREMLVYAGVSECDMEKGSLRCDVNVSVRRAGDPHGTLGTRVEIKNLNSFKSITLAIEHETLRQIGVITDGASVAQETRLFDVEAGVTRTMRTKEDEDDYRYFPEPDLPPAIVSDEVLAAQRAAIPVLPQERRARYASELGLSEYDAGVLTAERATSDFFEAALARGGDAKVLSNWITNDVLAATSDEDVPGESIEELQLTPERLGELVQLVGGGTIHNTAGRRVLREMLRSGRGPSELIRELGLEQVSDAAAIETWCRAAMDGNQAAVEQMRQGNDKAIGALIGPVMKASRGRANPALVRATFERLIGTLE